MAKLTEEQKRHILNENVTYVRCPSCDAEFKIDENDLELYEDYAETNVECDCGEEFNIVMTLSCHYRALKIEEDENDGKR